MGQVLQAGQGQITARQAAAKAGIPMTRSRDDHQQGLPLGHQRDLPRRPDDRRGRRRGRGRGRHGVDDERAVPPPGRACRLPHGQQRSDRLADQRRPVVRVRRRAHGQPAPRTTSARSAASPASSRTSSRPRATSAPPPRRRKAASPTRSRRSRSRSARATRSSSTPTKASGPARPPSRSVDFAPRSRRTARSRPATRRRSPTAPPR